MTGPLTEQPLSSFGWKEVELAEVFSKKDLCEV